MIDRLFSVSIELEGPDVYEKAEVGEDFQYGLFLLRERSQRRENRTNFSESERRKLFRDERWKLGVCEHSTGSTIWSTSDSKQIGEILGSIVENEGYEENVTLKESGDSRYFRSVTFRQLSRKEKRIFKQILEQELVN